MTKRPFAKGDVFSRSFAVRKFWVHTHLPIAIRMEHDANLELGNMVWFFLTMLAT